MKKKLIVTTAFAALMVSGLAIAQPRGFKAADANNDGNITRAELVAHLDKRFAKLDKDADGKITKEERKEAREARKAARFAKLDTDGNGSLSPEELQAHKGKDHRAGDNAGQHKAGKHHRRHGNPDTNKDGVIDKTEFEARAFKRFERIDANNDDVVSAEERKAAHAHHKKHRPQSKPE